MERRLASAGALAALCVLACGLLSPRGALTGWLGAAVMFQALPLTGLVLLAMMRMIRGEWEAELRPVCEAAARLWPLAAIGFVPVLIGMGAIYDWYRVPASSAFQAAWLGTVPFALRTAAWFTGLWLVTRSQVGRQASEGASAGALAFMTLGASLLAVDWLMSLDTRFHSSGFGLQLLALETGAGYMALLIARLLLPAPPRRPGLLGALLLVFMLLWGYFQFLPYLVIWSGNLPDGVAWYAARTGGVWSAVLWLFVALGMVPLLALLFPQVRAHPRPLIAASACALAGKALEFAWFAVPGRGPVAPLAFVLTIFAAACCAVAGLSFGLRRAEAMGGRTA